MITQEMPLIDQEFNYRQLGDKIWKTAQWSVITRYIYYGSNQKVRRFEPKEEA